MQLNQDSRDVSRLIEARHIDAPHIDARHIDARQRPADTLLVWGYRPDIFAYTQMPVAGRFLDSQLYTGVIADRHLTSTQVSFPILAERDRQQVRNLRPTWIVDGLGPSNPALAITAYKELKPWLDENYLRCGADAQFQFLIA